MSFWDLFKKKDKEQAVSDGGAGFVPMTAASAADSSDTDTQPHTGHGAESATSTDSGGFFGGGDGGGASGGDGGGGAN